MCVSVCLLVCNAYKSCKSTYKIIVGVLQVQKWTLLDTDFSVYLITSFIYNNSALLMFLALFLSFELSGCGLATKNSNSPQRQ